MRYRKERGEKNVTRDLGFFFLLLLFERENFASPRANAPTEHARAIYIMIYSVLVVVFASDPVYLPNDIGFRRIFPELASVA